MTGQGNKGEEYESGNVAVGKLCLSRTTQARGKNPAHKPWRCAGYLAPSRLGAAHRMPEGFPLDAENHCPSDTANVLNVSPWSSLPKSQGWPADLAGFFWVYGRCRRPPFQTSSHAGLIYMGKMTPTRETFDPLPTIQ